MSDQTQQVVQRAVGPVSVLLDGAIAVLNWWARRHGCRITYELRLTAEEVEL